MSHRRTDRANGGGLTGSAASELGFISRAWVGARFILPWQTASPVVIRDSRCYRGNRTHMPVSTA